MYALTVKDLAKTYTNGVTALKGISFTVREGDFFALLGPNGAGKSTTIGVITSLVTKTAGNVRVFDADIDKNSLAAKAYLGVVPQEFNFNVFAKVKDIVLSQAGFYGISRRHAYPKMEYYLHKLGLWGKRDSAANKLSGGMKRRLMIVRALVHEPRLLILDEPTAGVDIEVRRMMWQLFTELNQQGMTIVLTTHYLEEAENLCRNVAIIDHGEIVENTATTELLKKLEEERVILYLSSRLVEVPNIDGFKFWLHDPNTLEVQIPNHLGLSRLFRALDKLDISVISMRNKTNRLEELFIKLTAAES